MTIKNYRDLEVWQVAMELSVATYRLSRRLPPTEKFGLKSQIQRVAVSVPSNIAEGHGRSSTGDYLRFLSIARGSLAELETQVVLLTRLKLVGNDEILEVLALSERVGMMLNRLRGALARRKSPEIRNPKSEIR